jgi:hypothetical protein
VNRALVIGGAWILVLLGVCAVAFPLLVFGALANLGSHSGGGEEDLVPWGLGALLLMGSGVGLAIAVVMRLALGRWSMGDALRVSAAGFAPFMIGLIADPTLFISFVSLSRADKPVSLAIAAWLLLVVVVSLAGVTFTTRAAFARAARYLTPV